MSLFENDNYQWRETYFVLFDQAHRPTAKQLEGAFRDLGERYRVSDLRQDDDGRFESVTLLAPNDYAAMDIIYVGGEEVEEQVEQLAKELKTTALTDEDREKVNRIRSCTARFDVFHFEQLTFIEDEDEEYLDPGGVLTLLERLAKLCKGVAVDPQAGTVL